MGRKLILLASHARVWSEKSHFISPNKILFSVWKPFLYYSSFLQSQNLFIKTNLVNNYGLPRYTGVAG